MKVLKFGGTSVGSAERMQNVVKLINDGETKIVVLSAMSGTTNSLIEFTNYLRNGNANGACEHSTFLQAKYMHLPEYRFRLYFQYKSMRAQK